MNLVVMASGKAWRPFFFEDYRTGQFEKINRMALEYANHIYLAAVAIILFSSDVVILLADKQYHAALPLVPIIVLGYVFVFLYTLFFQYAAFRHRTGLISINTFIAGFANIGLNYYYIPIYGYQAAAYTTLASFALLFLLHYINARVVLKEKVLSISQLIPHLLVTCGIAVTFIVLTRTVASYPLLLLMRLLLMGLAVYLFVFRKRRDAGEPLSR